MADPYHTATAAAALNRKRPRHFHPRPDEAEDELRDEVAAAQPPATRLYKHALESIFGFLSLKELSAVLAVSRAWSVAVSSMRSVGAPRLSTRSLFELCISRLARHVGALGSAGAHVGLSRELLYMASVNMSGLRSLYYQPPSYLMLPLLLPPSLTLLDIDIHKDTPSSGVNSLIAAARIPNLRSLALYLPDRIEDVSFAPLARSAHLRELDIGDRKLNPRQVNEIRAFPSLTSLKYTLMQHELSLLLRPPHRLQLQKLQTHDVDEERAQLLASLPSLTDLTINSRTTLAPLQHTPNLRTLMLKHFASTQPLPEPERMIQGIGQCTQLTSLTIFNSKLTSAHISALLSRMPAVSKLALITMPKLESLQFLSSALLQRSLTSLSLTDCAGLPTLELRHVFALQQLTHLWSHNSFAEKLCSLALHELALPSQRLPKLVKLEISD